MEYSVALRTLKKWSADRLERYEPGSGFSAGSEGYTYRYEGSTCNNGGTPYTALLHVVISGVGPLRIVEDARIEIPEDQKEAASQMCAAPGTGAADAEPFFSKLAAPADIVGRELSEIISEEVHENFAGCFCGPPQINQKWKTALSTIHYSVFEG